jgi:transcriptional adapter 3
MLTKVSSFALPPLTRSALFKSPSDAVPPTEELKILHDELKILRQKSAERAKKAGDDLRTIEESMKRMKEKEKGKGKAVDKIKRERDCGLNF